MKFAFLGADSQTLALADEILRSDEHALVAFFEAGHQQERLENICGFTQSPHWESLIDDPAIDAIVIATLSQDDVNRPELREEQLRKLARGSAPLMIAHPACDALAAYELEMVRRESGLLLVPFAPDWRRPAFNALADLIRRPPQWLGDVEQIVWERRLSDRSRCSVLSHFSQDAALVQRMQGDITKVSATSTGVDNESLALANVNVALTGDFPALVRWTVQPADASSAQITLWGKHGKAVLHMPAAPQPWRLETDGETSLPQQWPAWNEPRDQLELFTGAVAGKPIPTTWLDACRNLELNDTLLRSLKRGRAVRIGNESAAETEIRNFKGVMAAGGCVLVLLVLLVLFLGALSDGVMSGFRTQDTYAFDSDSGQNGSASAPASRTFGQSLWRLWLVIPFVLFLAMQLLRFVIREPGKKEASAPSSARPPPSE